MAVINMLPTAIIEESGDPILEVLVYTRGASENNCMIIKPEDDSAIFSNQGGTTITGTYLKKDGYNIKAVSAGKYVKGTAARSDNQTISLSEVTCTAGETIYSTGTNTLYVVYKVGED